MSITKDGWLDWALRIPGPADKRYSERCTSDIFVPHSAVGYYNGWASRLFDLSRVPGTNRYTANAAASVTGWIAYDGTVTQHYPFTVACWASGSHHLNVRGNAFEHEGGFNPVNEPLTEGQIAADVRILQDMAAWKGRDPATYWRRPDSPVDPHATLYEHRETIRFGGVYTSCPNGRIPWAEILRRLQAEPEQEAEEMFHRWGGLANDGTFRGLGIANREQEVWGRHDWHLPHEAKSVEMALYLRAGQVEVLDGDKAKAGFATEGVSTHRVFMDAGGEGKFYLRSFPFNAEAVVEQIECLGWYS